MARRWFVGLLLGLLAVTGASALTPDDENVSGLTTLREELFAALRGGGLQTAGPWILRYTGPVERGTRVRVVMKPYDAFKTERIGLTEFRVSLRPQGLLTRTIKELRALGVEVLKTFEEPGQGTVYVTFQTKQGRDIDLQRINGLKMIKSIEWKPRRAAKFLKYRGKEAGFERTEGHGATPVEVLVTIREESHDYVYSAWLPTLGDAVALAPRACRAERVFKGMKLVTLRTPWLRSGPLHFIRGAKARAEAMALQEVRAHCEGTLGGELMPQTMWTQFDCQDNAHCTKTHSCRCAASTTYQCKVRQYETIELCN